MSSEQHQGPPPMVIVSGHLEVAPDQRDAYLATCVPVVEAARRAVGCLDFALSADLVEAGRINVFERWESQEAVEAFRGAGVGDDQSAKILGADVREYDISAARVLS
jgi:quinol monooxygenase YgiN